MALCSLSTGRIATPRRRAASVTMPPAMTRISLLASAIVLPELDGGEDGLEAVGPGRGAQHEVGVGMRRDRDQSIPAGRRHRRAACGRRPASRSTAAARCAMADDGRPVPRDLGGEELRVLAGREADDAAADRDGRRQRASALWPIEPVDPRMAIVRLQSGGTDRPESSLLRTWQFHTYFSTT